jgi:hypothetical protein
MSPDAHNPETEAPRAANSAVTNPAAVQNQQPGLAVSVGSIVAGVVGFSIIGMFLSGLSVVVWVSAILSESYR